MGINILHMKNYYLLAFVLFFLNPLFAQNTEIVYLSGTDAANTVEWDFFCTDGRNSGEWTKIDVPSNWELEGFGTYNYGHDWLNTERKLGKEHGLYKYEFEVPASWKGKTVNIVFDGSMTDTKVEINGKLAGGIHQGAFYRFKYDITKLLDYGKTNLLEVDVAKHSANESVNGAERRADFWIFGGIFRPVYLEVLPKIHMERTAIDARSDGSFNVLVVLNDSNAHYIISVELFDLEGNKIGETMQDQIERGDTEKYISGSFSNIRSWNPESPALYNLKITLKDKGLVIHEVTERIGFRTVELRKHDGFYINGEKVVFKGVCRHSFWPETGRCLSNENNLTDVRLMKEMNMNAVRMSHYIPDKHFLDLCDSLGLFVLNEVTGWQDGYDTVVGPRLIKEAVLKDENHPSVVLWAHGNEGGWTFANEKYFHTYDIQKRTVIYPWLLRNGVDTYHYPEFFFGVGRYVSGNDPFMATELLHGLYDGGHGAGLDDYWSSYESSALLAGGFLWDFADEAVLRTDLEHTFFDSDGNHASDGIVGPHREKEGSFYTIKEIWSPVQVQPLVINKQWDRKLLLKNKYIYTNLDKCSFTWKALKTHFDKGSETIISTGEFTGIEASPGETKMVILDCREALKEADMFVFTANGVDGNNLNTWSWPIVQPDEIAAEIFDVLASKQSEIDIEENETLITAFINDLKISFDKQKGIIDRVENKHGVISLSGGPVPVGVDSEVTGTSWEIDNTGAFRFEVTYSDYPGRITMRLEKSGLLGIEADPLAVVITNRIRNIDYIGISFDYPEEKCTSVRWMGRGPYRVWKNRIKGSRFGIWEKEYNNTITGESFNKLIYPEFKGYHGNLYWAKLETTESPIHIISETPNLYFQLFTPGKPQQVSRGTYPAFPEGDLSFLYEIPAIGTKFKNVDHLGPKSQKGMYHGYDGDENYPIKLWFDLTSEH